MTDTFATKLDVKQIGRELRAEIAELRAEIAALRAEIATLRDSIPQIENRIVIKLGGMMAVGIGVLATLMKIL